MFFIKITEAKLVASAALTIAALLVISTAIVQYSKAQSSQTGQSGLKFFIKYSKSANATGSQGPTTTANSTSATATKKITVNVNLQRGTGGTPIKLPITATVPTSAKTEDLQLCASLPGGSQSCQPLSAKGSSIDLTKQSQGAAAANNTGATPSTSTTTGSPSTLPVPKAYYNNGDAKITRTVFSASPENILDMNLYTPVDALIGITNTSLFVPVTVIVPVNVQIQNAQVCASVLSGGSQSCEQLVLNPSQTTFSPISVNLSNPTPTFTSTTPPTTTTTTSSSNPLSSVTNGLTNALNPSSTSSPSTSSPSSPSTSSPSTSSGSSSSGSTSGSTK